MFSGGIIFMILFAVAFHLFQDDRFYSKTLGLVSHNYTQKKTENGRQIINAKIPFIKYTDDDLTYWDAGIYKCLRDNLYAVTENCYGPVKAAYYPLFPLLWRLTGFSAKNISILNQLLFLIGLCLLINWFDVDDIKSSMLTFLLLFTFPSVINFQIPYSESLFMLTGVGMIYGILKKKYGIYFSGALFMAMVRPAAVFVMLAVLGAEIIRFLEERNTGKFLRGSFKGCLPFILGNFLILLFQFAYTGTFYALAQARTHWNFQRSTVFTDWSVEGFGMSVFGLMLVFIPTLFFLFSRIAINKKATSEGEKWDYLQNICMLYFIGITFFIFITQGLDLHSYSRYILSSPFFFLMLLITKEKLNRERSIQLTLKFSLLILAAVGLLMFLDYGGNKIQYSWYGYYGSLISALFLLSKKRFPQHLELAIGSVLIFSNLVWGTYLLNMFVSGAWIFT